MEKESAKEKGSFSDISLHLLASVVKDGIATRQARWNELNAMSLWERIFSNGESKNEVENCIRIALLGFVMEVGRRPEELPRELPDFAMILGMLASFPESMKEKMYKTLAMKYFGVSEELQPHIFG